MRPEGLEPPRVAPQDPKSCASTSSATVASYVALQLSASAAPWQCPISSGPARCDPARCGLPTPANCTDSPGSRTVSGTLRGSDYRPSQLAHTLKEESRYKPAAGRPNQEAPCLPTLVPSGGVVPPPCSC